MAVTRLRYRTIDLVTVAMLGVAVGIAFWGWSQLYHVLSTLAVFAFPPAIGLLTGPWLLGGVLGGLVIRKPGAALACEIIAASVEALLGNGWGISNLYVGAAQALGVELVLALVLYRRFGVLVAMASAAAAALGSAVYVWALYYADWTWTAKLIHLGLLMLSGIVVSGLLSWALVRALARTGALDAFGAGQERFTKQRDSKQQDSKERSG